MWPGLSILHGKKNSNYLKGIHGHKFKCRRELVQLKETSLSDNLGSWYIDC